MKLNKETTRLNINYIIGVHEGKPIFINSEDLKSAPEPRFFDDGKGNLINRNGKIVIDRKGKIIKGKQ